MGMIWRKAWHCDECHHEWLQTEGVNPERCPNRSCRTRNWHHDQLFTAPQQPESAIGTTSAAQSQPVDAIYQRPSHNPTCRCLLCHPK